MSQKKQFYTDQDNHPLVKMALSLGYKNFMLFYQKHRGSYRSDRGWHLKLASIQIYGWSKDVFISRMKEHKPKK
jgi:hypothetical protein